MDDVSFIDRYEDLNNRVLDGIHYEFVGALMYHLRKEETLQELLDDCEDYVVVQTLVNCIHEGKHYD
jgi:hypothetical protein